MQGPRGEEGGVEKCPFPSISSFAVKLREPLPVPFQPIVFAEALYNPQNHFNLSTGIFTCTIPGVYNFGFDIELFQGSVNVGLMRNSIEIRDKQAEAKDGYEHAAGNAVLQLKEGDRVWLESKAEPKKGSTQTVFFGYL
ncbi:protein HP-25 homolog 2-like [Elephas maximus indicus]|uniref:protein HP-25 homolog 2-like n=1 Tax=Elephas maximus indicus TaxID=99487 RepID=UPI00211701DF|nr:protein HP-25 homolog 2-like [Elephas maximus indicus]